MASQKTCVLGGEKGFRGEDKAHHAQGRCRSVGGDMAKVDTKVGARVQPMSSTGTKKVMVAKQEKERDDTKKKKTKMNKKEPLLVFYFFFEKSFTLRLEL